MEQSPNACSVTPVGPDSTKLEALTPNPSILDEQSVSFLLLTLDERFDHRKHYDRAQAYAIAANCGGYVAVAKNRDSSVERALGWRSKGPRFDFGSRHQKNVLSYAVLPHAVSGWFKTGLQKYIWQTKYRVIFVSELTENKSAFE